MRISGGSSDGGYSDLIETLDGRVSQVFEAKARARKDGGFAAQAKHEIALRADTDGEAAFSRIAFSAPTLPAGEPAPEPDFFQRLFGTAAPADPSRGLGKQSFRVKVVAPNEVVSTFDQPSVTCEDREILRSADESQHRSEEHTSELQSLMRISYAVFCLKKKKKQLLIQQ